MMSPIQIVAVAVRLFAVFLAVSLVYSMPTYYAEATSQIGANAPGPLYLAAALLVLGFVYLLWRFPMTIAGKLLPEPTEDLNEPAAPDLWLSMGCALMGLWLLVEFVPLLARDLMVVNEGYSSDGSILKIRLATDLPGLIIGMWLVLGAKGFRKLFWWARYAGRGQPKNWS